jgi:hypothetical protein
MELKRLEIIDARTLLKEVTGGLLALLPELKTADWDLPTCYPVWKVRNIAAHLLQTGIGRLSGQRDRYPTSEKPASVDFKTLVSFISGSNDRWGELFEAVSPRIITDLLTVTGRQLADFLASLDLMDEAYYAVTWAGEMRSKNWFDIAREYTEIWHHQQQIREAVSAPPITDKKYLAPVIDTLIRATPYWYGPLDARPNTMLGITITGDSGGCWVLKRGAGGWDLYEGASPDIDDEVVMSDDTAWRFLTRSISRAAGGERMRFSSGSALCGQFLEVKAILIDD